MQAESGFKVFMVSFPANHVGDDRQAGLSPLSVESGEVLGRDFTLAILGSLLIWSSKGRY